VPGKTIGILYHHAEKHSAEVRGAEAALKEVYVHTVFFFSRFLRSSCLSLFACSPYPIVSFHSALTAFAVVLFFLVPYDNFELNQSIRVEKRKCFYPVGLWQALPHHGVYVQG